MTFDHNGCGEYPPLTSTDFPLPAPGVVDALSPALSHPGGGSEALAALESLRADNIRLVLELAATQAQRDTALAECAYYRTHYTRTGW
jgi:hypothetical protein